jgi:hypothetical protein
MMAENRFSTHFEVISPVVSAYSGWCEVFVSQNDLDQSVVIGTKRSVSFTLTEKA